ncbi:hypothetical protein [Deinococcus ruber]|uniref:Lipoprotein n=1 Tax=Deinococcus ruber TaxID=1848197 RepID=A0A918F3P1_9DEIO|nr:hypothetical protein [Deinococcus ruber]GGQ98205.1 hypothetical protein GCM10008957_08170 [Deinococcus ruber]
MFKLPVLAASLMLVFTSCSALFNGLTNDLTLHPNPRISAPMSVSDTISGTYTGDGTVLFVKTGYRLVLNVNVQSNRADGVLTNLGNGKSYALTGKYLPVSATSGSLDAELWEGAHKSGTLTARIAERQLTGTLATPLFAYTMALSRQEK